MVTDSESGTDKGLGLTLAFGALATLGAGAMFLGAPELEAAWGFAAAVIFSCLAVVAIHLYWE